MAWWPILVNFHDDHPKKKVNMVILDTKSSMTWINSSKSHQPCCRWCALALRSFWVPRMLVYTHEQPKKAF